MKFMIQASYTGEGARGLLKDGGSARRAVVQKMVEAAGGRLECFYYSYGDHDVISVMDLPDSTSAIALSLAVNASGAVRLSTIPLIAPEEVDAAAKKTIGYRAPGA